MHEMHHKCTVKPNNQRTIAGGLNNTMAARDNTKSPSHGDQRRAQAIISEVRELCTELEALLLDTNEDHSSGTSLIGSRVKIIKGVHSGHYGRVIKRRGEQYWYIKLEADGRVVHKKSHNF